MTLSLKKKHLEEIVNHSKESFPIEACGILVGEVGEEKKKVKEVYRTKNMLNSKSRYQIDPEEQIRIFNEAEQRSLEVIGFYHSHPYRSKVTDIDKSRATYPGMSYVIYSNSEKRIRSFVWNGKGFLEEKIEISQD